MTPYELEKHTDGSITERKSYVPEIATFGATAIAALSIAFYGFVGAGISGGPPAAGIQGPPNTPVIQSVFAVVDSVTLRVALSAFAGSLSDTQDSIQIQADTAGGTFSSPLINAVTASTTQRVDTISYGWADGSVTDIRARAYGVAGGWSAWSSIWQRTISWIPGTINDLVVIESGSTFLVYRFTTVHDGRGAKANHAVRYSATDPFVWWETEESATEAFDSIGSAIAELVTDTITGLASGESYDIGIRGYNGTPGSGANYGEVSNIANGVTTGGASCTTPPTPTLTLAQIDTSTVSMTTTAFNCAGTTHTSTQWQMDNNSDLSSPFFDATSADSLVRYTVNDNTNFTVGSTYYGRHLFNGSGGTSAWSTIKAITITSPPPPSGSHEPVGMTPYSDRPFNSISEGWSYEFHSPTSIVTSGYSGTPPKSPTNVIRNVFPAGPGEGGPFGNDAGQNLPSILDTVYVRIWWQASANWQGQISGTNKQFFVDGSGPANGRAFFNAGVVGTGPISLQVQLQNNVDGSGGVAPEGEGYLNGNLGQNVNLNRATWYDLEFLFIANTPGSLDGEVHVWKNGTKTHEFTNIGFAQTGEPQGFADVYWAPIWGGVGDTIIEEMYLYLDHFYISAK